MAFHPQVRLIACSHPEIHSQVWGHLLFRRAGRTGMSDIAENLRIFVLTIRLPSFLFAVHSPSAYTLPLIAIEALATSH